MDSITSSVISHWLFNILIAAVIVIIGRIIVRWIVKLVRKLMVRADTDPILINFTSAITSAVLMLFVLITALNQLGVDTTSMIALLGAAGLAVGLALKDSLQNFAAGVMLIIFRPFKISDFIEAGGVMGVVEKVSIFSTIIKTADNREITVPNGQVYTGAITNFSACDSRRIDMTFSIGYDDDLLKAKQLLTEIVNGHEKVYADPEPVVAVSELADSSVNFIVRPWVNTDDYWPVRAELTEMIKLAFDEQGISIPYPQMDVHMAKVEA